MRYREKEEHCRVELDFGSEADFRGAFAKVFAAIPASPEARHAVRLDCIETPVGLLIAGATHDASCNWNSATARPWNPAQTVRRRFAGAVVLGSNDGVKELKAQ